MSTMPSSQASIINEEFQSVDREKCFIFRLKLVWLSHDKCSLGFGCVKTAGKVN